MERVLLILSTMDTKGPETFYLRDRIRECGGNPLMLDMGMSGPSDGADIPPEAVARAAGADINEIRASRERKRITRQMIDGASAVALKMAKENRLAGVIGLGGSTASLMASEEMALVAEIFANKLSSSNGPTIFLIPKKGWSAIDTPTGEMFVPEEDEMFFRVFKGRVNPKVITR